MDVQQTLLRETVRRLRRFTGESQQALAVALGLSVRAVANYEAGKIPEPCVLVLLAKYAKAAGRYEIADQFLWMLADQIGVKAVTL